MSFYSVYSICYCLSVCLFIGCGRSVLFRYPFHQFTHTAFVSTSALRMNIVDITRQKHCAHAINIPNDFHVFFRYQLNSLHSYHSIYLSPSPSRSHGHTEATQIVSSVYFQWFPCAFVCLQLLFSPGNCSDDNLNDSQANHFSLLKWIG